MNRIIVILLASVCLCAIILVGLSNFKEPKTIVAVAPNTTPESTTPNTVGTIGAGDPLHPSTPNGLSPQVVQDVLTASNGNQPVDGPRVNPIDMTPRANGNGGNGQGSDPATGSAPSTMPPMTGTAPTLNPNSAFIPSNNPPLTGSGAGTQPTTPVVVQQPNTAPPIQVGGGNVVMNQPGSTILTPPATTLPTQQPPVQQPQTQPAVQSPPVQSVQPVQQQPAVQTPPAAQPKPTVTPKPTPSTQVAAANVKGTANARVRFDGSTAILVLSGDKPFEYKSSQLGGPDRLLLDLAGNWQLKSPSVPSNRLFNAIRVGQHTNSTRIVVDLKVKPASWSVVRVSDSVIELHAR